VIVEFGRDVDEGPRHCGTKPSPQHRRRFALVPTGICDQGVVAGLPGESPTSYGPTATVATCGRLQILEGLPEGEHAMGRRVPLRSCGVRSNLGAETVDSLVKVLKKCLSLYSTPITKSRRQLPQLEHTLKWLATAVGIS